MKKTVSISNKFKRQLTIEARALDGQADGEQKRYAFSVSSEVPYLRMGFLADSWYEVLSHEPSAIDMSRAQGMPLLADHNHTDLIGVIESLSLGDRRLNAEARFSRSVRGQEVEQDVADGIRPNVSIGYLVQEFQRTGTHEDGLPIYTAVRWMPYEISSVTVPADTSVGMGRAAEGETGVVVVDDDEPAEADEAAKVAEAAAQAAADATQRAADEAASAAAAAAGTPDNATEGDDATRAKPDDATDEAAADPAAPGSTSEDTAPAADAEPQSNTAEADDEAKKKQEAERELTRLATEAGFPDQAASFLERGLSAAQAGLELLQLRRSAPPVSTRTNQPLKKESPTMKYSLARAIKVALGELTTGIEAEFDAKVAGDPELRRHGPHSVFIPLNATQYARALNTQTAAEGGATVFTQEGEFIDMLRNRSLAFQLGARAFTNLRGPVSFPKLIGGAQARWVAETPGVDVAESEAAFGSVLLSAKTLQATTAVSRQLLNQSSLDIEAIIQDDLAKAHALAIDRAVFHGAGGLEPLGLYNQAGVASVSFADGIDYGKLIDMVTEVAAGNALDGNPAFATNPRVAGRMAQTLVAPSAGSGFLWTGKISDGVVAGYDAACSNQIAADLGAGDDEHGLIFGNFSDVLVGAWGVLEVIVDPYSKARQGLIEVTTFQQADVAIRHGASFAKATGLKLD